MSTNRSPEWRGISRIDYKHTHGWFARIYLKGKRVKSKLFSDGQYESREDALEKAREWRDRKKSELSPEDRPTKVRYLTKPPKNNTSGRVGISKTFTRSKVDKNQKLVCFSVTWAPTPGKPKNRSFFFNIYGSEEAAFNAACEFRAEKEREMDGTELSNEEREEQVRKSIDHIMTYFDNAPEHRHERLRKIHALILEEFPDVKMWMKSTHPCYQRGERWIMMANRTHSISIQFHPAEDFAVFLPTHQKKMMTHTCVHYRDDIELELDNLRMLVRKVLGEPAHAVQHHTPETAEEAARKAEEGAKTAKTSEGIKGYARITKAIRRYIEKAPKTRQAMLWKIHSLIVDACPIVSLTIENGVPAYENNGAWLMLNNQPKTVAIAVSDSDALVEFAAKYPDFKSGNIGLMFEETADIPNDDFRELARNVLKPASAQQAAELLDAPDREADEAIAEAKRVRPLDTAKETVAAKLRRKRERLQTPDKQYAPVTPQTLSQPLPDEVRLYIETAPDIHRKRLATLHNAIVAICPDVDISMKYKMPSYLRQGDWMSFKSQPQSITLYGSDSAGIAKFAENHPDIKAGKMTLKLADDVELPDDDAQILIRKTFRIGDIAPSPHLPNDVRRYIEAAPKSQRVRLLSLHNAIVAICPNVDVSMKYKMPSYQHQGNWLSFKSQPQSITLYGSDSAGIAEFAENHPAIKAGKMTLKIADAGEIPADDVQILIRKTFMVGAGAPAAQLPDDVRLYIEAAPTTQRERLLSLHAAIVGVCPDVDVSMKYKMPSYLRQGKWMSFKSQPQSITLYCSDSSGITKFAENNPNIDAGKMTLKLADAVEIPGDAIQILIRDTFMVADSAPAAHLPDDVRLYLEAAPAPQRERLLSLHNAIVDVCPDVDVSMKYKMPSYGRQEKWMSLKSQPHSITVYGSDSAGIAAFAENNPDIKAGKMTLKIADAVEISSDDVQLLIRKTLLDDDVTPSRPAAAAATTDTAEPPKPEPERPKKVDGKPGLAVLTRPDPVEEYMRATRQPRQRRLRSMHKIITDHFPHLKQSTKFRRLTYEGQTMWMSIGNLEKSISVHVKNGIGIEEFLIQNPDVESGKTWLHLVDGVKIPRKSFQILVQRVFGPTEAKAAAQAKAKMAAEAEAQEFVTETPVEDPDTQPSAEIVQAAAPVAGEAGPKPAAEAPAPEKEQDRHPDKQQLAEVVQEAAPTEVKADAKPAAEAPAPEKEQGSRPEKAEKTVPQKPAAVPEPLAAPAATQPESGPEPARNEQETAQALQSIVMYITKCPAARQQRLFLLHSLVLGECAQVDMSMRLGMPTYDFQGHWVAIANQRNYVSLYVGENSSLADFVDAHPDIKSGKTCLNFVDGDEVPMLDTLAVIRKALRPKTVELKVA